MVRNAQEEPFGPAYLSISHARSEAERKPKRSRSRNMVGQSNAHRRIGQTHEFSSTRHYPQRAIQPDHTAKSYTDTLNGFDYQS